RTHKRLKRVVSTFQRTRSQPPRRVVRPGRSRNLPSDDLAGQCTSYGQQRRGEVRKPPYGVRGGKSHGIPSVGALSKPPIRRGLGRIPAIARAIPQRRKFLLGVHRRSLYCRSHFFARSYLGVAVSCLESDGALSSNGRDFP